MSPLVGLTILALAVCASAAGEEGLASGAGYRGKPCDATTTAKTRCDPNASCYMEGMSFNCECNEGYTGDGRYCKPLPQRKPCDATAQARCGAHSACHIDEHDQRHCSCLPGFVGGDKGTNCLPLSGCSLAAKRKCGRHASCHVEGSSTVCKCLPGYTGEEKGGCYAIVTPQKVQACSAYQARECSTHASCRVGPTGPICSCLATYIGDGHDCIAQSALPHAGDDAAANMGSAEQDLDKDRQRRATRVRAH